MLSRDGGKIRQLVLLDLDGPVYVLGDGYTDYQIREAGLANRFYAYTENVSPPHAWWPTPTKCCRPSTSFCTN